MAGGGGELCGGEVLAVVAAGAEEAVHERVAVGRQVAGAEVVTVVSERAEQPHRRRRGVEADGVAHPRVAGRVAAQHHREPHLATVDAAEPGEARGQRRAAPHPLGVGDVAGHPVDALLERHRHRDDPAVELGEGDVHHHVDRAETGVAPLPALPRPGGGDRLHDGDAEPLERRRRPLRRDLGAVHRELAHREGEGADQGVAQEPAGGVAEVREGGRVVAVGAQRVAEDRERAAAGVLERGGERVDHGEVAGHPVGPVEDEPDHRPGVGGVEVPVPPGAGGLGILGGAGVVSAVPGDRAGWIASDRGPAGGVAEQADELGDVGIAAVDEVGEAAAGDLGVEGAQRAELGVGGEVAGPGDERDAVGGAGGGDGVGRLGDGAAPAEEPDRHAAGPGQQRLEPLAHVLRGPAGAAHPHHPGAALGKPSPRRRQRDELGVRGGEEDDQNSIPRWAGIPAPR